MKIVTEHFMHAQYFISWTLFEFSSNIISLKHLLSCQFSMKICWIFDEILHVAFFLVRVLI